VTSNNNDNKVANNHLPAGASSSFSEKTQQAIITVVKGERKLSPFAKRILVIDDDSDITLTFKQVLEAENNNNEIFFKVYTYNDPLVALSQFKPNFYDLLLIDINMPKMNGFELSTKILEIDINPRICFMSSGQVNQEALREQYPTLSIGCFITKPVTTEYLVRRIKAELD
jgi:CheY-like chemotaxis protein